MTFKQVYKMNEWIGFILIDFEYRTRFLYQLLFLFLLVPAWEPSFISEFSANIHSFRKQWHQRLGQEIQKNKHLFQRKKKQWRCFRADSSLLCTHYRELSQHESLGEYVKGSLFWFGCKHRDSGPAKKDSLGLLGSSTSCRVNPDSLFWYLRSRNKYSK